MRRVATICVVLSSLIVMVYAADVLSQLGVAPQEAKEAVDSIINSGVNDPGLPAKAFKLMPAAARAEVAAAGIAWLKTYTASPEFTQQYAKIRENHKPEPPAFEGTPDDEMKKADEEQKQQEEKTKQALAAMPAEQRAEMEKTIKAVMAQMNSPEMRKIRLDGIKDERASRTKQYEQELATWKRDYPESPAPVVAKRLREFLAMSAEVDYAAKLTSRNGKMVFANEAYEQKPEQWKMCYRAGKEAITAARAGVQAWLKELGG